MNYAKKIKKIRKQSGLNQVAFAKELKVTQGTISKLEGGSLEPSIYVLKGLHKKFKVDIKDFLFKR